METLISRLASPSTVLAASAGTALVYRGHRARFLMAVPLALGVGKIIKHAFPSRKPKLFDKHAMQSFPSGHSSDVAAYATSLALASRKPWLFGVAALAMAAVNGARILEGEHRLRDCIAGDLLGIAAALTTHAIVRSPSVRRRAQQLRARVTRSR
jgi:membrane-associated phospholipid phosphatase